MNSLLNFKKTKKKYKKNKWTKLEDQLLLDLVSKNGIGNWSKKSQNFTKRKGKQLRERWYNYLNPVLNHNPWTKQDEELLFICVKLFGQKWKFISQFFENRSENTIKNHYHYLQNFTDQLNVVFQQQLALYIKKDIRQIPLTQQKVFDVFFERQQKDQKREKRFQSPDISKKRTDKQVLEKTCFTTLDLKKKQCKPNIQDESFDLNFIDSCFSKKNKENQFCDKEYNRKKSKMQTMAFIQPESQTYFVISPLKEKQNQQSLSIDNFSPKESRNFSIFNDSSDFLLNNQYIFQINAIQF